MKRFPYFRPAALLMYLLAASLGLTAGYFLRNRLVLSVVETGGKSAAASGALSAQENAVMRHPSGGTGSAAARAAMNLTLEERLALSPRIERRLLLAAAAEQASPDRFPDLLKLCEGDGAAQRMMAARWADIAPADLWHAITAAGRGTGNHRISGVTLRSLTEILLDGWLKQDPAAAVAAFDKAGDVYAVKNLRIELFDRFLKAEPERTLRLLDRWIPSNVILDLKIADEWMQENPERAAEVFREGGASRTALKSGENIGAAWAKTNPAAALEYAVTALAGRQRLALASGALRVWAEREPQRAADFIAAQTDSALRAELAAPLVTAWAGANSPEAMRWVEAHLQNAARVSAIEKIVDVTAQRDLAAASELVDSLETGNARNEATGSLARQWMGKEGVRPVIDWLISLPDENARHAGFRQMQGQWIFNNPEDAAAFLTGPHADLAPAGFSLLVATAQARKDPEAAMQWVEEIPAAARSQARDAVLSEWINSRPEAASAWILQRPAGTERDQFLTVATRSLAWCPPEAADGFISGLGNQDRQVVRTALEGIGMNETEKAGLLKKLEKQ